MKPEQWRRVKDPFEAALHIPQERQVAFLEDTCDDDAEVRAEVEKLLWGQEPVERFPEYDHARPEAQAGGAGRLDLGSLADGGGTPSH